MGPLDFHSKFVGRTQQQRKDGTHNLADLPGIIGIDGSSMIYNVIKTELGSAVFDVNPQVPLYNAKQKFVRDINSITRNGREVIVFLDGRGHPVKRAGENRSSRQEAHALLRQEYSMGPLANYEKVKRLRKQCVFRRDDFTLMIIDECRRRGIKVFCAPFEADWQLVAAQQAGIIHNIISDDGDLFVIGGDNIMTEVNYYTGRCCFYKRSDVLQRQTMSGVTADLPALSTFLGNDYIARLHGNGPVKSAELTKQFIAKCEEERKSMIDQIAATRVWNQGDNEKANDFAVKFWNSYNLLHYPPVFKLLPTNEGVEINLNDPSSFDVILVPLHSLPEGTTHGQWNEMIGFGESHPSSLLKGDAKELFLNNIMPDTGHPPEPLPQPLLRCQPGEPTYEVAHGAYLDESIPLHVQADWSLQTYAAERNLRVRGAYNRQQTLRVVRKTLELTARIGPRAPQPREYTTTNNTAYDVEEPLEVRDDLGSTLEWSSDWSELMNTLEFIDTLGDEDFFNIFEPGRNGIQVRAERIIVAGGFNIGELQIDHCRIKSNKHNAIAIRMRCVPSQKSEPYWVTFVCDLETKKLVPPPTSRCGCPAGLSGCSHIRALYAVLCVIQDINKDMGSEQLTQEAVVEIFPPPMSTLKKIPIPWSFVFKEDDADRALKKEKKMNEYQQRCTATIQQLNFGQGFDDDDNDDDSYSPSDEDSVSMSSELSDEWDDEFDSDEESAVDYDDEDLEDTDEVVETLVHEDRHSNERNIKLCAFVHNTIGYGKKRAEISNIDLMKKSDYKYERSKISDHLRCLLDGKGGPNESVHTKLRQLRTLQRQDDMFERRSDHWDKCLQSHYLYHTRKQRLVLIAQLEHAIVTGKTKGDLNWLPERLAKLPPGYDGLGDRGFEGTSTSYPHFNEMKTPYFLDGREQFTYAEMYGSRDLCQGRYGSEVYNKRTNDFFYLHDKIPRSNFLYFEEVLKWSMLHANLCQPFLIPRGASDYFPTDTAHLQRPAKRKRAQKSILSQPSTTNDDTAPNAPPMNYIEVAMPERYYEIGLENVGLLMDGKDCVTDTVRVNSFLSRSQYSDKMHSSAARYIMWVLPCGLSVTYTPLFLGRASEKALVEYWGGSTYDLL